MGLRFRKSINLGGGFRINISGSGIGYSWGGSGYRYTKTSDGRTRQTFSIPGTGISWVEESGGRRSPAQREERNNYYYTENIYNAPAENMVSVGLEEIIARANRAMKLDELANFLMILSCVLTLLERSFLLLLFFAVGLKIFVRKKGIIDLHYDIDEDQLEYVRQRMDPMLRVVDSNRVWRIFQNNGVINVKYSAGAETEVKRILVDAKTSPPFPFKSDNITATFATKTETLVFLPDKLFIIQGRQIGALDYQDISARAEYSRFVEDEGVPRDSDIVGWTWRFVNKDGGPDRRFNNNIRLPICRYGKIILKSPSGLNTIILFSNANLKSTGRIGGYGLLSHRYND